MYTKGGRFSYLGYAEVMTHNWRGVFSLFAGTEREMDAENDLDRAKTGTKVQSEAPVESETRKLSPKEVRCSPCRH